MNRDYQKIVAIKYHLNKHHPQPKLHEIIEGARGLILTHHDPTFQRGVFQLAQQTTGLEYGALWDIVFHGATYAFI